MRTSSLITKKSHYSWSDSEFIFKETNTMQYVNSFTSMAGEANIIIVPETTISASARSRRRGR